MAEYCVVKCEIFARNGWDIGEKLVRYDREMYDILMKFGAILVRFLREIKEIWWR